MDSATIIKGMENRYQGARSALKYKNLNSAPQTAHLVVYAEIRAKVFTKWPCRLSVKCHTLIRIKIS